MSLVPGVAKPGLAAGVESFAGVLTGEGALGAGVSRPPNEKPDFAAGVVVAAAGVAVDDESLDASFVVVPPPKLNPPAAAGVAVVSSAGLEVAAPPNVKPPDN